MDFMYLISFLSYLAVLVIVGLFASRKQKNATDFMVGNRSINYWVTAVATHATDMSTWLFMAFPGMVYREGISAAWWTGLGLVSGAWMTWQFIAPKLRIETERIHATTLPSLFEIKFRDHTGLIRLVSSLIAILFFTFYIAAGIVGLGVTMQLIFSLDYHIGITIGTLVITAYVLLGGFTAVAWNDFLQGMFVLMILVFMPFFVLAKVGGIATLTSVFSYKHISLALIPDYSFQTLTRLAMLAVGWGLGYFGMPHVLVNFMGIERVQDMKKSQYLGLTWQIISLASTTIIGLVGVAYFSESGLANSEHVFIELTKALFSPFCAGFILCGILAAAITTIDTQLLVSASMIAEDLYKRFFDKTISSKKLLHVSRLGGLAVVCIAYGMAFGNTKSVLDLVLYAWEGLGSSFGPLVIASLFFPHRVTWQGALTGLLVGGTVAGSWSLIGPSWILAQVPAYPLSFLSMYVVTQATRKIRHV